MNSEDHASFAEVPLIAWRRLIAWRFRDAFLAAGCIAVATAGDDWTVVAVFWTTVLPLIIDTVRHERMWERDLDN